MPELRVNIPDKLYKSLEKIALITGMSIESTVVDILRSTIYYLSQIDSYYSFRITGVDKAVNIITKGIDEGIVKLRSKHRENILKYVKSLGKLLAIIEEVYGKIPNKVVLNDLLRNNDIENIVKKHIGGGVKNVDKTLINLVNRIKPIAGVFKIKIISSNDESIELLFENPAYLENFVGIGSRVLRRRVRR
ncbi:MAG: hypothetical protein QXP71_02765 [Desulfurococcaceae archaeon]